MTLSCEEEARYAVTFINKTTKTTWVRFIKYKSETSAESIKFIKIFNNIGVTIKRFRTNGDTKYNKIKNYYDKEDIQWGITQIYSPDMNGDSENIDKNLIQKSLTILYDAALPKSL